MEWKCWKSNPFVRKTHRAIVSFEGGTPKILGCLECDWDDVLYDDHEDLDDLTPRERFELRCDSPKRCVVAKRDGARCSLPAEYGDACRRHRDDRALWDRSYSEFRSPWRDVSLPEAYREVFIRAIRDADLVANDQKVPREAFEKARELRNASAVYFMEREGLIKIGVSTNVVARLRSISKGGSMPDGMTVGPVDLLATMPGDRDVERDLHERFRRTRVKNTEWFRPSKPLLRFIEDLQRAAANGRKDILDEALEVA